jgi:hypothetical protein
VRAPGCFAWLSPTKTGKQQTNDLFSLLITLIRLLNESTQEHTDHNFLDLAQLEVKMIQSLNARLYR